MLKIPLKLEILLLFSFLRIFLILVYEIKKKKRNDGHFLIGIYVKLQNIMFFYFLLLYFNIFIFSELCFLFMYRFCI